MARPLRRTTASHRGRNDATPNASAKPRAVPARPRKLSYLMLAALVQLSRRPMRARSLPGRSVDAGPNGRGAAVCEGTAPPEV